MNLHLTFAVGLLFGPLGAQAQPTCSGETEDVEVAEEHSTQLLQVSHTLQRGAAEGFWDLQSILTDSPHGMFLSRMEVIVRSVGVTYNTSRPLPAGSLGNATLDIFGWERLRDFDRDPSPGGVFARVFADRGNQAAIIAFKGVCTEASLEQCQIDQCYLLQIQNYGPLSSTVAELSGFNSKKCAQYKQFLDYTAQARQLVRDVQAALPQYSLLLTGHSLGGMLAITTAAQQPKRLKALTFAPTPFNWVLSHELNFTQERIRALNAKDLVATCDPYDCGINAAYAHHARAGAETCLYLSGQEPKPCEGLDVPYLSPTWREHLSPDPNITATIRHLLCKGSAHRWQRYEDIVLRRTSEGGPSNLPVCSTDFSVLTTAMRK